MLGSRYIPAPGGSWGWWFTGWQKSTMHSILDRLPVVEPANSNLQKWWLKKQAAFAPQQKHTHSDESWKMNIFCTALRFPYAANLLIVKLRDHDRKTWLKLNKSRSVPVHVETQEFARSSQRFIWSGIQFSQWPARFQRRVHKQEMKANPLLSLATLELVF